MAKKKDVLRELSELVDKALRRGEKLEKTLLKIVTRSEPNAPAETFLKSVRDGMEKLRADGELREDESAPEAKSAARIAKAGKTSVAKKSTGTRRTKTAKSVIRPKSDAAKLDT